MQQLIAKVIFVLNAMPAPAQDSTVFFSCEELHEMGTLASRLADKG